MITADVQHITRLRINSDGDGVRSVVFMHGCPLNCFWCCNPETRFRDSFKRLTPKQLNKYIEKDKVYFKNSNGGVTFGGGEPLLYVEFIESYIKEFCAGFSVNVETSLFVNKERLVNLVPLVNEWYVDYKIHNEQKHQEFTGKSNNIIRENLRFLSQKTDKSKIIITFPMITDYNTEESDVFQMIEFLKGIGIYRISLHPYRKEAEEKQRKLNLYPIEVSECNEKLLNKVYSLLHKEGFAILRKKVVVEKDKCIYLKNIRKSFCKENNIALEIKDCNYTGRCTGTCPQCEYELSIINEYMNKTKMGKYVI